MKLKIASVAPAPSSQPEREALVAKGDVLDGDTVVGEVSIRIDEKGSFGKIKVGTEFGTGPAAASGKAGGKKARKK